MLPRGKGKRVDVKAPTVTAVKSTDGNDGLKLNQIADSIAALKNSNGWLKKEKTPKFSDEAATVYIDVVPKVKPNLSTVQVGLLPLPHPLSLNRSVCYFGKDITTDQQRTAMELKLKNEGVLGKITVLGFDELKEATEDEDDKTLAAWADNYDTHLCCPKSFHAAKRQLGKRLAERNKCTFLVRDDVRTGLASTALWANGQRTGYAFRVGHCGLTNEQLNENVAAALKFVSAECRWLFPDGISSVRTMTLKTGIKEGVVMHQDDSAAATVEAKKAETWNADDDWSVPQSEKSVKRKTDLMNMSDKEVQRTFAQERRKRKRKSQKGEGVGKRGKN